MGPADLRAVEEERAQPGASPDLVALNDKFFVIEEGGEHFVACEDLDSVRRRRMLKRFTFAEYRKRFLNKKIQVGDRAVKLADAWLGWEGRRQFLGGVVFNPTKAELPSNVFNLWRGWPIHPRRGDWSVIQAHLHDVVAAGNEDHFRYVLGWLARLVQHPERPGEVVLVLRGEQGAGKSLLGTALQRLWGQHAVAVSSPRAVTGQFNAHLRDLVLLVANEAVFAGDRAAVSTLKALITDETLFIEQKGVDAVEVPNFLHVVMTTNALWAVPVALDDRRFAVFDVASSRIGDRAYFKALADAIADDRVIAAMLHDLLDHSLSGFEVRDIPATAARAQQMVASLEGEQAWLFYVLALGSLEGGTHGWPLWASTTSLQASHEAWAKGGRFRHAADPAALGRYLARFFQATRPRRDNPGRERGYALGELDRARARFLEVTGLPANAFPDEGQEDE